MLYQQILTFNYRCKPVKATEKTMENGSLIRKFEGDFYTIYDYGFGDIVAIVQRKRTDGIKVREIMLPASVKPHSWRKCDNVYTFRYANFTWSGLRHVEGLTIPEIDDTYIQRKQDIPENARHLISCRFPEDVPCLRAGQKDSPDYVIQEIRLPLKRRSLERMCDFYKNYNSHSQ